MAENYIIPYPIGQSHEKNDTLDDEKAQERWDFTLFTLSKEAQAVSITDCQAGNPCLTNLVTCNIGFTIWSIASAVVTVVTTDVSLNIF
ncbi:hypothetical protein Tco_1414721 [Tanacetum coccineum]